MSGMCFKDIVLIGATITGTTTVSPSVTIVGALTVAGVQFKPDGANLGVTP